MTEKFGTVSAPLSEMGQRREYTKDGLRDIGWAVKQMHGGSRVRRAGWVGRGMWLMIVHQWAFGTPGGRGLPPDFSVSPFVLLFTENHAVVPWTCSQSDLLAVDWELA